MKIEPAPKGLGRTRTTVRGGELARVGEMAQGCDHPENECVRGTRCAAGYHREGVESNLTFMSRQEVHQ